MSAKVQGALFPLMFATNQPYTVNQQTESEEGIHVYKMGEARSQPAGETH